MFNTSSTRVNCSLIGGPFKTIQPAHSGTPQHVPFLHEESPNPPVKFQPPPPLPHQRPRLVSDFPFSSHNHRRPVFKFPRLVLAPCQSNSPVVVSALPVPTPLPTRTRRLHPKRTTASPVSDYLATPTKETTEVFDHLDFRKQSRNDVHGPPYSPSVSVSVVKLDLRPLPDLTTSLHLLRCAGAIIAFCLVFSPAPPCHGVSDHPRTAAWAG